MAVESLGGVSVTIDGDLGPLKTAFTQAQASAQQAGAGVAAAFNAGAKTIAGAQAAVKVATDNLASAQKQLAGFIVAGNAEAIATLAGYKAELVSATAALTGLAGAQGNAAAATAVTTQAIVKQTAALSGAQQKTESFVGKIPMLGVAAEKFVSMIPGLGGALTAAFPVFGAIALWSSLDRLVGKAGDLKAAEEELAKATKATDEAFSKWIHTVDSLNVAAIARDFGAAAGQKSKAKMIGEEAKDSTEAIRQLVLQIGNLDSKSKDIGGRLLRNPILAVPFLGSMFESGQVLKRKTLQQQIDAIKVEGLVKEKQIDDELQQAAKTSAQDAGGLLSAQIQNQISANASLATLARTKAQIQISTGHAIAQAQINEIADAQNRNVASAAEQVRMALETRDTLSKLDYDTTQRHIAQVNARAAAEAMGKTPVEAARIRTSAAGETAGLTAAQYQKETDLQGAYLKATDAFDEAVATRQRTLTADIVKEGEKRLAEMNKQVADILEAAKRAQERAARIGEIEAKGAGVTGDLAIQANRLAAERAYGDLSMHTAAQNVAYARQLATYDAAGRAAKIEGLQAELRIAQGDVGNENHLVRAATIQQQINALKLSGANADYAAATKNEQAAERLTMHYQIQSALRKAGSQIPGALGSTLATAITGGGPKGQNVGQQIAAAMKDIGVHLLGDIFKKMIEQLIATTVAQSLFETAQAWLIHYAPNPFGFFAAGGRPPIGVPSWIGERGKELWIPDEAGVIVPNNALGGFGAGGLPMPSIANSSSSVSNSANQQFIFHISNARDTRETVRAIATYMKSASPKFSTASK